MFFYFFGKYKNSSLFSHSREQGTDEKEEERKQKEEENRVNVSTIERVKTIVKFFSENGQFKTAQDKKFFDACVSNPKYVKYTRLRTDADAKTTRTKNDAVGIIADSIRRSIMPEEVIEKLCKANDKHEFKDAYAFNKAVRKHITDLCSAHNGKILQEKRRIEELTRQRAEQVLEKFGVATVSGLIDNACGK
jgi:hypothetical protein